MEVLKDDITKLYALFSVIDEKIFEMLGLLMQGYYGRYFIGEEWVMDYDFPCFVFWDDSTSERIIFAITPPWTQVNKESMKRKMPDYDKYIVLQFNEENKWFLLDWLKMQRESWIPPALRGIRRQLDSLKYLFDYEYEDIEKIRDC